MVTLRELWKKASKKYKPQITDNDFVLIVVASSVSGGVSFFLGKTDWNNVSFIGIFIIDFVLTAFGLALIIGGIVFLFFKIIRFLNILGEFLRLARKSWKFGT